MAECKEQTLALMHILEHGMELAHSSKMQYLNNLKSYQLPF